MPTRRTNGRAFNSSTAVRCLTFLLSNDSSSRVFRSHDQSGRSNGVSELYRLKLPTFDLPTELPRTLNPIQRRFVRRPQMQPWSCAASADCCLRIGARRDRHLAFAPRTLRLRILPKRRLVLGDRGKETSAEEAEGPVPNNSSIDSRRIAASQGKPYLVRCEGSEPVESKTWLTDQLEQMRTPP